MLKTVPWLKVGAVFLGVLLGVSVLGLWRSARSYERLRQEEAEFRLQLSRFHSELAEVYRSIILLSSARDSALLTAGYSPQEEYERLKQRYSVIQNSYQRLEPVMQRWFQEAHDHYFLGWAIVRTQSEWRQLEADLEAYLKIPHEVPQREIPNLNTLRAFREHPLDSLWQALKDLQAEEVRFFYARYQAYQRELWGLTSLAAVGLLGLLIIAWYRWVYPTRLLQAWLKNPGTVLPPALRASEWASLLNQCQYQTKRLQEVEQFMRDLAMGRTPQPLTSDDPDDRLVRSSQWLLERLESESQRKAV
ncbi:MAG: hypothetical protein SNJ72_05770 [Fimbriimonadales bacterium]